MPDVLYIFVGDGGKGGNSGAAGTAGQATIIGHNTIDAVIHQYCRANGGGGGVTGGKGGNGGYGIALISCW